MEVQSIISRQDRSRVHRATAKANPGKINVASAWQRPPGQHLSGALFKMWLGPT